MWSVRTCVWEIMWSVRTGVWEIMWSVRTGVWEIMWSVRTQNKLHELASYPGSSLLFCRGGAWVRGKPEGPMHTFSTACNTRMRLSLAIFATSSSEYPRLISSANRLGNLDTSSRSTGTLSMTISNSSLTLQLLQCKDCFKKLEMFTHSSMPSKSLPIPTWSIPATLRMWSTWSGEREKEKSDGTTLEEKGPSDTHIPPPPPTHIHTCNLLYSGIRTAADEQGEEVHHHYPSIVWLQFERYTQDACDKVFSYVEYIYIQTQIYHSTQQCLNSVS